MNKELLMQVISEAIDNGASITINAGQFDNDFNPVFKEEALRLAEMFQAAIGGGIEEVSNPDTCESFRVTNSDVRFYGSFSHSPARYMQEDIDLTGGEEIDIAI